MARSVCDLSEFKDFPLEFTFNTPLLVLALALVLLPALYAFFAELISPAARYPEAGYAQRLSALSVQQALSVTGVVILTAAPFLSPEGRGHSLIYWLLISPLCLLQVPQFWLRAVDLRQAVRGVHWAGAKKRNGQLQLFLLLQIVLAVLALLLAVEWTPDVQSA